MGFLRTHTGETRPTVLKGGTLAAVGCGEACTALAGERADAVHTERAVEAGARDTVQHVAGSSLRGVKLARASAAVNERGGVHASGVERTL